MTIDAGWVKLLKKGAPHAFTARRPFAPAAVFIDGQIKLMKSDAIRTWETFLKYQFLTTIEHAFATGARTVVLGFDDYEFVPTAKSMTQRKRMSAVAAIEFNLEQELPACIPECWPAAIKNRAFKSQVVGFVLRNLRARFRDETERTLIIDYRGAPEVLGKAVVLPRVFYDADGGVRADLRRGECDVKAWAWAELGPLEVSPPTATSSRSACSSSRSTPSTASASTACARASGPRRPRRRRSASTSSSTCARSSRTCAASLRARRTRCATSPR